MVVVELEHGDEEPQASLADALEGVEPVSEALEQALHGVDMVPAPGVLSQAVVDDPVVPAILPPGGCTPGSRLC